MACIFIISCLMLPYLFLLQLPTVTNTAKIPSIIFFGDSIVDPGNNNYIPAIPKCDFPPYGQDLPGGRPTGRFSDGRIIPDFLAQALGFRGLVPAYLDPEKDISDFAVAVSFASGGTGYDNETSHILNVVPLWKEVEYYKEYQQRLTEYLGSKKARQVITEALYVVSLGTNDFLINYDIFPTRKLEFTVDQYVDFLIEIAENFIRELYDLGARKFSYSGVNVLGCLPLERTINTLKGHGCREVYNKAAKNFNGKLGELLGRLNSELPGIRLVLSDQYEPLQQMIMEPQRYGFEVTDKGCCGTGTLEVSYLCNKVNPFTCPDADKYIFWDSIHLTDKANGIVSEYLFKNFYSQFLA